ncbi:MAG TPA: hypothetical protein PKA41_00615 [Verrucomicrobiota bacterium]|nr:hypothetical protein [Verrucomicrobiota bacterium]
MGLLNLFSKPAPPLMRLPSGTFTVDRDGRILVSTLSSTYPVELVKQVGRGVLETFREAQSAQLTLSELVIIYGSLKITAREMRGGAIVFLAPQTPISAPERQTQTRL